MEYMTAEQALEAAKGLTFEDVWAALMESRRQWEETKKEMKESQQEMREETRKIVADLSKNIGGLSDSFGRFVETMFTPELWKKFNALGFPFSSQCQRKKFTDGSRVIAEVDVLLENGEYAMPVEVKTRLTVDNVNEHIERIEIVRRYMDAHCDARKLVGAVAGGTVPENVRKYAHKHGLYVIKQSGESASIAELPQGFKAREWTMRLTVDS